MIKPLVMLCYTATYVSRDALSFVC